MALVLAVEPDHRQASILKRIVREQVRADLVLVDSRDAAVAALTARIPDVILLTALLSPRDEEELVAYLRTLAGAQHIQTHTIPQLASTAADMEQKSGGGLFGKLLGKKEAAPKVSMGGCDPDLFADEIRTFIETATERKSESVDALQQRVAHLEFQAQPTPADHGSHATTVVVLGSTGPVVLGSRPGRPSLGARRRGSKRSPTKRRRSGGPRGRRHSSGGPPPAGQRRCGFGHARRSSPTFRWPCSPKIRKSRTGRRNSSARPATKPRRRADARGGSRGRAAARGGSRAREREDEDGASP